MNISSQIISWLKDYAESAGKDGFVVGISGGVDSSLTSTLCASTGKKVLAIRMPIHQIKTQDDLSKRHGEWLKENFDNVEVIEVNLSQVFDSFTKLISEENKSELSLANTRSRIRMITLYQFASTRNSLVAGTGNKVEDFGVGFFTKYGDGGVDVSPIADLYKSEVREVAKDLGVIQEIIDAAPTDGLWEDGRTDEDQLGATYEELEWAMSYSGEDNLTDRQNEILEIYDRHHTANLHKMKEIPVCKVSGD